MKRLLVIPFLILTLIGFSQGSEMINNGGFSSVANWSVTGGWSISGDTARYSAGSSLLSQINANMISSVESLAEYKLEFDCVVPTPYPTGYAAISFCSTDYKAYIANNNYYTQHYILYFTAPADIGAGGFVINSADNNYAYKIDNVSLKKCDAIGESPYYVATNGDDSGSGAIDNPWKTWQRGFDIAQAGDTVWHRGGTYYATSTLTLDSITGHGHSGTASKWIYFLAYPGEVPILDYSRYVCMQNTIRGMAVNYTTYVYFKGLTICNVWQRKAGITASGIECFGVSNLTFDNVTVHDVGGRGFGFFGGYGNHRDHAPEEDSTKIPDVPFDTTRYINCDAYNLCDTLCVSTDPEYCATFYPGGIADGYKFNNTLGSYVSFEGCRTWDFADNGFDPNGDANIVINNSWAFHGGWQSFEGYVGEGGGIKYGNYNPNNVDSLIRIVTNCISAYNSGVGYDENNARETENSFNEHIYNNISYHNRLGWTNISRPEGVNRELFRNNLSYQDTEGSIADFDLERIVHDHNSWDASPAVTVTDADFISLDTAQLRLPRKADGSLPDITFGRLSGNSDLIGAGIGVGMSATPDIGIDWAWLDAGAPEEPPVGGVVPIIYSNVVSSLKSIEAISGGNITSDGGTSIIERGMVYGTSANPTTSNTKIVVSGTTGLFSTKLWSLKSNTTYHVRSFATNSEGTSYGADVSFTTKASSPLSGGGKVYVMNGRIVVMD